MSAIFNNAADVILSAATANIAEGTVALWAKTNWAHTDATDHNWFQFYFSPTFSVNCQHWVDNNIYTGWISNGVDCRIINLPANYNIAAGVWKNYILDWKLSTDVERFIIDGVQIGIKSPAGLVIGVLNSFAIGNHVTPASNFDGKIGRVMIWSRLLTAPEIATVAAGGIPTDATGRVAKYDLLTDYNDSWGVLHGTNTGTTLDGADNPPSAGEDFVYHRKMRFQQMREEINAMIVDTPVTSSSMVTISSGAATTTFGLNAGDSFQQQILQRLRNFILDNGILDGATVTLGST